MGLFERFRRRHAPPPSQPDAGTTDDAREALAREVEAALQENHAIAVVSSTTTPFAVSFKSGTKDSRFFLDNLFAETRELSPEARKLRIRTFVASAFQETPPRPTSEPSRRDGCYPQDAPPSVVPPIAGQSGASKLPAR